MKNAPRHIAIIMDGNGRWAQNRHLPRSAGHRKGVEALRDVIKTASELSVEMLTVFAFSTENWKRPAEEIGLLMKLLLEYIRKELDELDHSNVKITTIGDISPFSKQLRDEINYAVNKTQDNTGLIFNIALNYGGRNELTRAIVKMMQDLDENKIQLNRIDESTVNQYLDTSGSPDPDLLIRTSGEMRISNFLIWQLAYTELYFTDTLWPDFDGEQLRKAVNDFQNRSRRFGGL